MNANDVIESYVTDVAVQLPRRQRNDVALELRSLLHEELQAKAQAAGRDADAGMATELMHAFGRPADVAARYRPTLIIVDPADGQTFARATFIGLGVIWCAGLLKELLQPIDSAPDILRMVSEWWTGTVIASLWWPGLLVVSFAAAAWSRRRWPQTSTWKARAADRIHGTRASLVMGIVGIACGVFLLLDPTWMLDVLFNGRAAPAAYEAFVYTDTFRHRQAPILLVLVLLNIPLLIAVILKGRWPAGLRHAESMLGLITCAVLAWVVFDGPVFMVSASDRTFKFFLLLIIAFSLIKLGVKWQRSVKPMSNSQAWQ